MTTTTARSAKYIARLRAFLDAGRRIADDVVEAFVGELLQHALDAFLVSASLSRVCDAASTNRVSKRLSLISACFSVHSLVDHVDEVVHHAPLAAHDQIEIAQADVEVDHRDLLAAPGEADGERALVVVLPTPPLPDVTTIISVNVILPFFPARASTRSEFRQHQTIAVEPGLHGLSTQILRHVFENAVLAGNRHQLRMEFLAKNTR